MQVLHLVNMNFHYFFLYLNRLVSTRGHTRSEMFSLLPLLSYSHPLSIGHNHFLLGLIILTVSCEDFKRAFGEVWS